MALSLVPGSALAGVEEVCDGRTEDQFPDDDGSFWENEINCIASYEIVGGFPDGEYKPARDVTRAEMTRFMVNTYETATGETVTPSEDYFDDDDGHVLEEAINQAAEVGIVIGEASGDFNPGGLVSRAAMSAFVSNMVEAAQGSDLDGADTDAFTDDENSGFEETINKLAANDIVQGVSDTEYDPTPNVYRGEMAGFTLNAAGYLDDNGFWNPPAGANQTFSVTPQDDVTLTVTSNGATGDSETADDRQYTVENPVADTEHTIALFPADSVNVDANGNVTFTDDDDNDEADGLGNVNAWITVVNGTSVADDTQVTTANPAGGQIEFTVDGDTAESVIPVVFFDEDGGTAELDLDANNAPVAAEVFGIGGTTTYQPAEAAEFSNPAAGTVVEANTDEDYYTLDNAGADGVADVLVRYETGDTFQYTYDEAGTPTTVPVQMSQFESWLSADDTVDPGVYNPGATNHELSADVPNAPTNLTAENTDADDDGSDDDITVTWDEPTNPSVDYYSLSRAPVDADGEVGTYAEIAEIAAGTSEYDDNNLAAGTYSYRVNAVADPSDDNVLGDDTGETDDLVSPVSNTDQATVAAAADTTAPSVTDLSVSDNTVTGTLDDEDQVAVTFDEAVTLTDSASITFRDGDGSVGTISRGGNATMTQNADGDVVFVTLTANPVPEQPGGTLGLDPSSLEIVNSSGIEDEAGTELAEVDAAVADGTANDAIFTITFQEPITEATLTEADIIRPTGVDVTSIAWNASSTVATVTLDASLTTGQVAGLEAQSVTGQDGGNGPASDVTFTSA